MPDATPPPNPVLYAEDDANDAFFMRRAFAKLNAEGGLHIVPTGRAALGYLNGEGAFADRVRHPLPSLLILDVKMPELSGLEVLEHVRQRPEFASLPIVMFTSSTQESDVIQSRRLGANAYLVKPSNSTHLASLMQQLLDATHALPTGAESFQMKENLLLAED